MPPPQSSEEEQVVTIPPPESSEGEGNWEKRSPKKALSKNRAAEMRDKEGE